jgi:hypothetical protein
LCAVALEAAGVRRAVDPPARALARRCAAPPCVSSLAACFPARPSPVRPSLPPIHTPADRLGGTRTRRSTDHRPADGAAAAWAPARSAGASAMQEGGKLVTALAVTFVAGIATGWVLNSYTRKGLDKLLQNLQRKVKSI